MKHALAEIVGIFLLVIGFGVGVAAAGQVSNALALAVLSLELIFAATVTIYVASELDKAAKAADKPKAREAS